MATGGVVAKPREGERGYIATLGNVGVESMGEGSEDAKGR